MPLSRLFYNPEKKSALVCDWDFVSGRWKCNGGTPYLKTQADRLEQLREKLSREGYRETPFGPDAA